MDGPPYEVPNPAPPLSFAGSANVSSHPVFPDPAYNEGTKPVVTVTPIIMGIAANTPEPEAAWAFVEFLVGEEGAVMTARQGRPPAYRTDAVLQAWLQRPARSQETDRLFEARLIVGEFSEQRVQLLQHIMNAANRVFSGAMTVDESIAQWRLDMASIGQ